RGERQHTNSVANARFVYPMAEIEEHRDDQKSGRNQGEKPGDCTRRAIYEISHTDEIQAEGARGKSSGGDGSGQLLIGQYVVFLYQVVMHHRQGSGSAETGEHGLHENQIEKPHFHTGISHNKPTSAARPSTRSGVR